MAKSAQAVSKKKAPQRSSKKDNFAVYAALFAVTLLIVLLVFYFFAHSKANTEPKQTYVALPQLTFQNDGQVVQLQVTVQVNEKDQDWAQKNNNDINEIFKKSVQEIDPSQFRSKAGNEAVLKKLKEDINSELKVNKIEAVLYKDMLIQHQVE